MGTAGNDLVAGDSLLFGGAGDDTPPQGGAGDDVLMAGLATTCCTGARVRTRSRLRWLGVADYRDAATAVTINLDGFGNSGDQAAGKSSSTSTV